MKTEHRLGDVAAVRLAMLKDSAAITLVLEASREAGIPYLPKLFTREQIQRWIETSVLANSTVWIAEEGNRIVGFLALSGVELDHLYIDPEYWSKGFGTRLLEQAKRRSPKLRLWTFQRNQRSRKFYEMHGFTLVSLGDGSGNEEREPDVCYEWNAGV